LDRSKTKNNKTLFSYTCVCERARISIRKRKKVCISVEFILYLCRSFPRADTQLTHFVIVFRPSCVCSTALSVPYNYTFSGANYFVFQNTENADFFIIIKCERTKLCGSMYGEYHVSVYSFFITSKIEIIL